MVTMKVLSQTNLQDDFLHSLLISWLRGLAALQVAAAHLRAQVFPGFSTVADPSLAFQALAFLTGFAHQAVVVFFVLSGWLVGGSLLNRRECDDAMSHYAIDRVTRLWIVLIPTFLVILAFGMLKGDIDPGNVSFASHNEYSVAAFFGNLVGLQNILVPTFGANFPLWSLANETWYYVLFPLLLLAGPGKGTGVRLFAIVGTAILAWLLSGPIILYFTIWLMGVAASRIRLDAGVITRWALLLVFFAVAVYFRMRGKNDDMGFDPFVQDYIFSVAFLFFLCSTQIRLPAYPPILARLKSAGKFLADFSFTLYVLHVPLIGVVGTMAPLLSAGRLSPNNATHSMLYLGLLGGIVLVSYLFHLPFEANTHRLRSFLKRGLVSPKSTAKA